MVITLHKETNTWLDVLKFLVNNVDLAKKGHSGFFFQNIFLERFDLKEDPFSTCCYTNPRGKITTLRKQYFNEESIKQIFSFDFVEVSMVGGPKWGSSSGNKHCMRSLSVDHTTKNVVINFRNSDFFKKFLVDIYFVRTILSEVGIKDYTYSCHFENLTLRVPFVYLFLNELYKAEGELPVKQLLESNNQLIASFLSYYRAQKGKKITYKSLERCARRMKETSVYNKVIKEYIE